jgi:hypothetical protein
MGDSRAREDTARRARACLAKGATLRCAMAGWRAITRSSWGLAAHRRRGSGRVCSPKARRQDLDDERRKRGSDEMFGEGFDTRSQSGA